MENNTLKFIDESGKEVTCRIIFTFDSEEFKKSYVIFYPIDEETDDEQIEVMAASYVPSEDGNGELMPIDSDEEWELVEEMLQKFEDEDDEGCNCDDCECDDECECCNDEDGTDDCNCGCCHHEKK